MKRILSALLASLMMLTLVACGGKSTQPGASGSTGGSSGSGGNSSSSQGTGWVPAENIELVIPFSAGGGSDIFARKIVEIIESKKMCPVSVIPNNKPGGSGVVGYTYLNSKGDSPYFIATTSSSFYSQPLSNNSPLSCYDDFSFVSHLCKDPNLVVANPSRGLENLQDMIDFAKANPGVLKYGGTGNVSDDAILMYMLNKLCGIELVYVPYDSGAEVLAAILGGHIDLCGMSPSEAGEHLTSGALIPLAVSADQRLDIIPDVPTFEESGIAMNHQQSRGVVMNAGVPQEAVEYYSDLMRQVTETEEWQKFLKENVMVGAYMPSEEYVEFNKELADNYKEFLSIILAGQ